MSEINNKYGYIQVGIDISETVRATLGPKGMNKMVIKDNKPIITNDGATIIKNIISPHPIGGMFKQLAESQERAIGDGTTTTTILAGELLRGALVLLNKKIHPVTIINGYNLARLESNNYLGLVDRQIGTRYKVLTTLGDKIPKKLAENITDLLTHTDINKLRVAKIENKESNAKIIKGYLFEGYTINDRMDSKLSGKIAVLDLKNNMEFAKFNITNTEELTKIEERQRSYKKEIVKKLKDLDVKVLFYTDTNPQFESILTENKITGVVVYKREYLDSICKVIKSTAISDPTENFENYIGEGNFEYIRELGSVELLNDNSEIQTLVISGPTKQILDETERALDDALGVMKKTTACVAGAGAFEIGLSLHLREMAQNIGGKEQLAIEKFADAIETIPHILAENCGFDAIEVVAMLKARHKQKEKNMGVDPNVLISDALERHILDPVESKYHAINSATEVANLILKLDNIYQGSEDKPENNNG